MSQAEKTFKIDEATRWAQKYALTLCPYAEQERLLIVGSVRRQKSEVHDLEIMLIPLPAQGADLFGGQLAGNALEQAFQDLLRTWGATKIQAGPKKKKVLLPEGIVLEIHTSQAESWAVESVIRTGPAEFSHWCVMPRKHGGYLPSDCRIHDGWQVFRGSKNIPMKSEAEFLDFLGLGWVEPRERTARLVPGESIQPGRGRRS